MLVICLALTLLSLANAHRINVFTSTKDTDKVVRNLYLLLDDVKIFDCTVSEPGQVPDAIIKYHRAHIPSARFLDLRYFKDLDHDHHMLPGERYFKDTMKALGVKRSSRVFLYDQDMGQWASRCYWIFRVYGHENVQIINGGFKKWTSQQRRVEQTPFFSVDDIEEDEDFDYSYNSNFHRSVREMMHLHKDLQGCDTCEQLVDSRNASAFYEDTIDYARNLPWDEFVNEDATIKSNSDLRKLIKEADLDYHRPASFFA
jgi:thiosulfate/3-mercaptopyruvate sulfurtransferase